MSGELSMGKQRRITDQGERLNWWGQLLHPVIRRDKFLHSAFFGFCGLEPT
jgi:hypothetical protein